MIGQQHEPPSHQSKADGNNQENTHVQQHSENISTSEIGSCDWWKRRSSFERVLCIVCLLLLLLCVALVIFNVITQSRLRIAEKIANGTCSSKECILAASSMLDKMDVGVEPCDNFYEFACGSYLRRHTVPDDHHLKSTIQTMQEDMYVTLKKLIERPVTTNDTKAILKVKQLYNSCMNTSSIEDGSVKVLLELLTSNGIGAWPILKEEPHQQLPDFDLEWRLAMLHVHQVQPFFHSFVAPDDRNSSVYLLHIYSGSPILNPQYYLNTTDPDYARYILSYQNLIAETVRLLKAPESSVRQDIEAMLEFETEFANILELEDEPAILLNISQDEPMDSSMNETNTMEDDLIFNRVNISMLDEMIPEIKWNALITYIFDYIGLKIENFDLNIVLHCEKYLRHLVVLLNKTTTRTVANYLSWRFVAKYLPYLDIHFRRLYYDFRREVPNLSEERTFFARWKECVHLVNDGFGMALASLYVNEKFDPTLEDEIKTLISSLKHAFIKMVQKQKWMNAETKTLCEEKVMAMSSKLGFPRYILDPVQLDKDYLGLDVSAEHFLNNILEMNRFEVTKELSKMTRTVDKERDWFAHPLVVNAYYEATGNAVIFPAGILRPPIFTLNRPKYLNYGKLGVIIGHEITHGFDNSGRKFDKAGNMTQWWSDEIVERFREQAGCYIEQFSQLPIEMVNQNVNGNQTLDDNICDNSGLQQAYRAYTHYVAEHGEEPSLPGVSFSNEQVFFLQYAQIWCEVLSKEANERYVKDSHSPGKYRANIPLINSPEFSRVFNCPSGTPMNPVKKCRLWG